MEYCTFFLNQLVKVKKSLTGQEAEAPRFQDNRHMKLVKAVSPTHRPPLSPRKYSWYSFLLEARVPQPTTPPRAPLPPSMPVANQEGGGGRGETRSGEWHAEGRLLLNRRLGKNLCLFLPWPHLESWHRRYLSQENPLTQPYILFPHSISK